MTRKLIKILSIDGGGVRGIIPAVVMNALEQQSHLPISSLFDLIAGASTGAILALGLSVPDSNRKPKYDAADAITFYEKEARLVFKPDVLHKIFTLGGLFGPKYRASALEHILQHYFGPVRFGDALTQLLIPTYDIENRQAYFFTNENTPTNADSDFYLWEVARAATAAATIFPPMKLRAPDKTMALIDGGIYANNPAMCALAEVIKKFPDANFLLVSLGTGELTKPLPLSEAIHWGIVQWLRPILCVVFDGIADTVDYQLKKLLPAQNNLQYYYRFQTTLTACSQSIDDTSAANLARLETLGEKIVDTHQTEIAELAKLLVSKISS